MKLFHRRTLGILLSCSVGLIAQPVWAQDRPLAILKESTNKHRIWHLRFSPDSKVIAAATLNDVSLWDVSNRRLKFKIRDQEDDFVMDLWFGSTPNELVLARHSGLFYWDINRKKPVRSITNPKQLHVGVTQGPIKNTVRYLKLNRTRPKDYIVTTWNLRNDRAQNSFVLPNATDARSPSGAILSVSGRYLAADLRENSSLGLWDLTTGKKRWSHQNLGPIEYYYATAFAPNEKWVATSATGGVVNLWDVTTGKLQKTYRSSLGRVTRIAISADNALLAASGEKGTVVVWDFKTGQVKKRVSVPGDCWGLAFAPNRSLLAVGSKQEIWLWKV